SRRPGTQWFLVPQRPWPFRRPTSVDSRRSGGPVCRKAWLPEETGTADIEEAGANPGGGRQEGVKWPLTPRSELKPKKKPPHATWRARRAVFANLGAFYEPGRDLLPASPCFSMYRSTMTLSQSFARWGLSSRWASYRSSSHGSASARALSRSLAFSG